MIASGASPPYHDPAAIGEGGRLCLVPLVIPLGGYPWMCLSDVRLPASASHVPAVSERRRVLWSACCRASGCVLSCEAATAVALQAASAARPGPHRRLPDVPAAGLRAPPPDLSGASGRYGIGRQDLIAVVVPLCGQVGTYRGEVVGRRDRLPGARRAAPAVRPVGHSSPPPMIAGGASPPDLPLAPGRHILRRHRVPLVIPFKKQLGMLVGEAPPGGGFRIPTAFRAAAAGRPGGHSGLPPVPTFLGEASPPHLPLAPGCHIFGRHRVPLVIPFDKQLGMLVGDALPGGGFRIPTAFRAAAAGRPDGHSGLPPMPASLGEASPPHLLLTPGRHVLGRHRAILIIPLRGYLGMLVGEAPPGRGFRVPTTLRAASAASPVVHARLPPVSAALDGASPPCSEPGATGDAGRPCLVPLVIPLSGDVGMCLGDVRLRVSAFHVLTVPLRRRVR